jgi:hypothetical protein
MLGYTDLATTQYLERQFPKGLHLRKETLPMLEHAYGNITIQTLGPDSLDENDVTMAYIEWEDKAHYFIVARVGGRLYAYDPHTRAYSLYTTYISTFKDIKYQCYLDSPIRNSGDNAVTSVIIDIVMQPEISIEMSPNFDDYEF